MAIADVRPAAPDDARAVTTVQREVWTTAWAGFLPAGLTEGFDDEAVSAAWARTAAGPGLWVAVEGPEVVGFCLAGPAGEEDVVPREYRHGDDVRRVHWRSTARRGELMVRRELAINFTEYEPDYWRYDGLPNWARKTLEDHASDPREYLYTREQLEAAE